MNKKDLEIALKESIKLQSHYASLLNHYDGGKRLTFKSHKEWLERLYSIGRLKKCKHKWIDVFGHPSILKCEECEEIALVDP